MSHIIPSVPPVQGKKILITGGAGFIGTHLAERLVEGNRLVLFDNYRRDSLTGLPIEQHPNVKVIRGDVLSVADTLTAAEGCDIVLHLGAIAGVSSYYTMSLKTLQVNILGTVNMLESAVKNKVSHFVHFSTSEVFGSSARNVTEQSPHGIGPTSDRRWVYATSKLAGENFTLRYGEEYHFATTAVRPFNVYGPRQTGEGAISNFCTAALDGKPLMVYNEGSEIRAWCYISDMVNAVMLILAQPEVSGGHSFNIGNPQEARTTLELAQDVASLIPGSTIERKTVVQAEVKDRIPNIDKAKSLLGYNPEIGLIEGLQKTIEWYRSKRKA